MINLSERTLFTLVITIFVGLLFYLTFSLSPVARQVTMTVVAPTFGLLLFQLALDLIPGLEQRYKKFDKADLFGVERMRERSPVRSAVIKDWVLSEHRELSLFIWISLLLSSVYLLGFLIALPLYILLYLRMRSNESWKLSIAIAIGVGGPLYWIFLLVLRVRLYDGILWHWLGLL